MCLHSWLTKQSACANTVGLPISVQAPRSSPKLCQCARPLYQGLGTGPASVPAHLRGLGLILACAPAYLQGLSSYQCAGPLPVPQVLPVHKCTPSPASTQVYPPTFMLCQYTSVPAHLHALPVHKCTRPPSGLELACACPLQRARALTPSGRWAAGWCWWMRSWQRSALAALRCSGPLALSLSAWPRT